MPSLRRRSIWTRFRIPGKIVFVDNFGLFTIAGVALLVVSAALAIGYKNTKQFLDDLWAVDTYEARELRRMCSGGFDATVEVQGQVSCDNPIISLAARVPCCWFRTQVEREDRRTRTVTKRDSEGRTTTRTETYYVWVTDFDEAYYTTFKVHDATGYTLVDPQNADIDTQKVYEDTIHHREDWFGAHVGFSDTGKYRITEEAFLPEGYAFVLGEASIAGEDALIHYPRKGYLDPRCKHFLISRRTEKEITKSKQNAAAAYLWFSVLALLAAAFCFVAACGAGPVMFGHQFP